MHSMRLAALRRHADMHSMRLAALHRHAEMHSIRLFADFCKSYMPVNIFGNEAQSGITHTPRC